MNTKLAGVINKYVCYNSIIISCVILIVNYYFEKTENIDNKFEVLIKVVNSIT